MSEPAFTWTPPPPDIALTMTTHVLWSRSETTEPDATATFCWIRAFECPSCGAPENVRHDPRCAVLAAHGDSAAQYGGNVHEGYYELPAPAAELSADEWAQLISLFGLCEVCRAPRRAVASILGGEWKRSLTCLNGHSED